MSLDDSSVIVWTDGTENEQSLEVEMYLRGNMTSS
jgi:hypothetical protein